MLAMPHVNEARADLLFGIIKDLSVLFADAEAVLIGVENEFFTRQGHVLCLCGEGAKTCACGNDLTRSVLRRLDELRARWRVRE